MIIIVKPEVKQERVNDLIHWIESQNLRTHLSTGDYSTIIGVIGDTSKLDSDLIRGLDIVENVKRVSEPYKNANRKFHPQDSVIQAGADKRLVGGGHFAMIAGPCSVESEEQIISVAQSVKAAGGYLIQLMPGAAEDTIAKVEGGIMAAGAVSAILEKNDDPEAMLRTVMSDFDLKILETCPVEYRCYCSRERVERALISLGRTELEQMLSEQGGCQLTCQFCDAVYEFTAEDIQRLLKNL